MSAVSFSYMAFIILRYVPYIHTLLRVVNHKLMLNFVRYFPASIRWSRFLSFILLTWCIPLIDLQILNHPYILGINTTWSWCMILLMYSWMLFVTIFLGIFSPMSIRDIGCNFLFLWWSLSGFGYQGNASLIKWVWKYSLLFKFLEEFQKDWYSFFKCLIEFISEAIWFWTFFCWQIFDYWFSLLTSNSSVHILFLHDLVLVGCICLEIYPFLLGCPNFWCMFIHSSLLQPFIYLWYVLNTLSSKSLISILLRYVFKVLSCSFVWNIFLCYFIFLDSLCWFLHFK